MIINIKIKRPRMRTGLLFTLAFIFFAGRAGFSQIKNDQSSQDNYDIAAYIWPSTHNDPRAEKLLWPDGIGEWQIIKKGTPRFPGHYQPKIPLWGYEMGNDPAVMEKWIRAATDHDVNVFVFDWYWFGDAPFLEGTLDSGFLRAKNNRKMKFYLMWADHDVPRNYWNVYKYKNDHSLLWHGAVDMEVFKHIVKRVINKYFKRPNYYKIEGKPVFSIFNLNNLIKGLGGLSGAKKGLDYFRSETRKAGFPGLHIQTIVFGSPDMDIVHKINYLGINSATRYNWGGPILQDYIHWGTREMNRRTRWDSALSIPYFANASIGFDDTPRFPGKGEKDLVHYNKTPTSFAAFLQKAKEYADEHPNQPKLITIYAWNEWVEGSYLLPDMKYGFKYLNAVKKVISGSFDSYSKKH